MLRKEIEERIAKYEALLARAEGAAKRAEADEQGRIERLVMIFDAMSPEEAAARIASLDEATAARIVGRMKPRKAAPVLAAMPPAKAAAVARRIAPGGKKIPAE